MLDQNKVNQFTAKAKAAGYNDAQIAAEIARKKKELETPVAPTNATGGGLDLNNPGFDGEVPTAPPVKAKKTFGGFIGNVFKSGGKAIKDIATAGINIFNPNFEKNTVANLGKLAVGTGELLIPGEQGLEDRPRAVGKFYKERYGSVENIKKTLYEDPVGAALDASVVLGGAGAVVKGVGTAGKVSSLTRTGEALTTASRVVDPLQAVGKLTQMGTTKIASKTGKIAEGLGADTRLSATKVTKTQMKKFEDLTGNQLDNFIKENGLEGRGTEVVAKTQSKIEPLQKQYNSLVRSGEKIDPSGYIAELRKKASDLRAANLSPEAEAVANKLDDYANIAQTKATVNGKIAPIPVDMLTNTKSSLFASVPGSAMADPASSLASKTAGGIAIQQLDNFYPGSAEIGHKLQALREFEKIATTQQYVGKGSQLVNILKSNQSGPILGYIAGSIFGNPLIGASAGLLIGLGLNNPKVLTVLSKMFESVGKGIPKIESKTANITSGIEKIGKYVTRALPSIVPSEGQEQQDQTNTQEDQHTPSITQSGIDINQPDFQTQEKPRTATKFTVEEHLKALAGATAAGDKAAIKEIKANIAIEEAYQKEIGSGAGKPLSGPNSVLLNKANTAILAVDRINESLLNKDGKTLESGKLWAKKLNPLNQEGRQLGTDIVSAIDILGYFRTGAAITAEQRKDYIYMFPNELDDKDTVEKKIKALKTEFEGYAKGISASGGGSLEELIGGFSTQ